MIKTILDKKSLIIVIENAISDCICLYTSSIELRVTNLHFITATFNIAC